MLSDTVRFEVVELATAVRLAQRLARGRPVILVAESEYVKSVVAELHREPGDLAALLRDAEAWVREESLGAIRYELDGRAFVLDAGDTEWSVAVVPDLPDPRSRRAQLVEALGSIDSALAEVRRRDGSSAPADIRGLEDLRDDVALALRLLP
ncbi:MAG TPA: hypothetical protein VFJ75_03585 [Gaiellaceae bacterium]|nr:hypothetical protein [Gaiellaceae bacterium]